MNAFRFDVNLEKILRKISRTITKYHMLQPGDSVVVAVSGGPDSVCLLDVLSALRGVLGIRLIVAHFDHGLRPGEDEGETRFVEALAHSLSLPFVKAKWDLGLQAAAGSLEERARDARYRFLEETLGRYAAQKIALGHNLNDHAETVLMRLLRGSGRSGLAGIPPKREGKFIRPLIELTRGEVEQYLKGRGLSYVTDPSNLQCRHLRNQIRLELLPVLQKYQPRIVEILGNMAEIMRKDEAWMEEEARKWITDNCRPRERRGSRIELPLRPFLDLAEPMRNRVVRQAIRLSGGTLRGLSLRHIEAINRIAAGKRPQTRIHLPHALIAERQYEKLFFQVGERKKAKSFLYVLKGPGTYPLKELSCTISLKKGEQGAALNPESSPWIAILNGDKLSYPMVLRNFRPGDRLVPLGMRGQKKIKALLIDLKIPAEDRARIPILTCGEVPVWVCGLRIDERFKVTPETKNVLKAELIWEEEDLEKDGG